MFHLALIVLAAVSPAPDARQFVGDYAGWAYIDSGGDLPLRLHITDNAGNLSVTFDLPSQHEYNTPAEKASIEGDSLHFERTASKERLWTFDATLDGRDLTGTSKLGDDLSFTFQLSRSDVALPTPAPDIDSNNYTGTYRADSGASIVITAWFWDELRYVDTNTGRIGTLFATSPSDFFAGSAEYLPAPKTSEFHFELDDAGKATALVQTPTDGKPERFQRMSYAEHEITFTNENAELHGTLILPPGPGPHAAIVVVGGSNWRIRGNVRTEADIFASLGLAAFIFDKRGNGESTGETINPFATTASDMAAAVRTIAARSEIRDDAVGVFGASRGGWFAPLAASKSSEIAFTIVFVAPAVSPAQQETTRRMGVFAEQAKRTDAELAEARHYLDLLWKATDSEEDWERYVTARDAIEAKGWGNALEGLATFDSDDARWCRLNMRYDPIPALEKLHTPILALFGERDANVTPAQNLEPFRNALKRAGNNDAALVVIPGANHGLRPVGSNPSATRIHNSVGYAPDVWRTVRTWLRGHKLVK